MNKLQTHAEDTFSPRLFSHFSPEASEDTLQTCPWTGKNRWWPQITHHYSLPANASIKSKALFPFPSYRRGWRGRGYYQLQDSVVIKEYIPVRVHCSTGEIQVQQWIPFTNRYSTRELYRQMLWRNIKSASPTQVQLKLVKNAEERCVTQCTHGSKIDHLQGFPSLLPWAQIGFSTSLPN